MDSMNMNSYSVIVSLLSSMLLVGCGSDKTVVNEPLPLIMVSDGFALGEKPAASIYFGKNDQDSFCDITIQKSAIAPQSELSSVERNNPAINASCNWDNKNYVLSSKHPTKLSLKFGEVDSSKIELNVSLTVVDVKSLEHYMAVENIALKIDNPDDLKKLLN
ncbi:hypothetical protein [Aeromonas veronii]|uniref:hypothetical protein n=1 Tax=Aeromonas veronii TaxID=654 RepID=UPI0012DA1493|nr:hypothetical protein [Aeromonas veronii]